MTESAKYGAESSSVPKRPRAKPKPEQLLRELRAERRRIPETVYVRTYVRRPLWQRSITVAWLLIGGIFIGGGVIPHVEDKPYLHGEAIAKRAVTLPKTTLADKVRQPLYYTWAPAEDVTEGYRIAFYQDDRLVRTATVTEPRYEIALPAGSYRWVVWIVGRSKAIVNSEVTTP